MTYTLKLSEDIKDIKCDNVIHVHLLKRYHPATREVQPPALVYQEGHRRWEIEAVINHRIRTLHTGPKEEYKVAFTGYGPFHNKWLPLENMEGCDKAIAEYHARRHAGIGQRAVSKRRNASGELPDQT